jgi:iron-sulfur cluster repair protein YtfE (RIC family)
MSDILSCFLQKEATIETKYVGTINTVHVVISSKNKQKQRVTAFKTIAGQMKPPHHSLLTWGRILFELVSYWLASDDMMLHIHVFQHFNIKLY